MSDAFICDYVRTPVGRYGGALKDVRADDLGAHPLRVLMQRNGSVDWEAVGTGWDVDIKTMVDEFASFARIPKPCCWPDCRPRCLVPPSTGFAARGSMRSEPPPGPFALGTQT